MLFFTTLQMIISTFQMLNWSPTETLHTASSDIVTEFMSWKGYFVPTQHKLGCIFSIF